MRPTGPDGGPAREGAAVPVKALAVRGQTTAAGEPSAGAPDDPTLGQHNETELLGPADSPGFSLPDTDSHGCTVKSAESTLAVGLSHL